MTGRACTKTAAVVAMWGCVKCLAINLDDVGMVIDMNKSVDGLRLHLQLRSGIFSKYL